MLGEMSRGEKDRKEGRKKSLKETRGGSLKKTIYLRMYK